MKHARTLVLPLSAQAIAVVALAGAADAQLFGFTPPQTAPTIIEQKVTAFDMAAGDIYGGAVAISGNRAFVANEWDDPNGTDSGSIYAYSWNGTDWQFDQKFSPADNQDGDNFGRSMYMQGNRAIVGAHWDDDKGTRAGSAYVLQNDGTSWSGVQKLTAGDGQPFDAFGNTVCMDGDWIAVGAWQEDQGGNGAGAAYMFRYNGSLWVQDQKLLAPDAQAGDNFGRYVWVSGERVIVGSWLEDTGGTDAGAAYIYKFNGNEWVFEKKLFAPDTTGGDLFGWACAIEDDVAVVTSYQDDDNGTNSGSVYVYTYNGSNWVFDQKLTASDGVAHDWFGYSVALDGDRIAVAATVGPMGTGSGYAYVFRWNGVDWVEQVKLQPYDGADQDKFGFLLALSDGVVLSGAWRDDDAGPDTGSAYFYRCSTKLAPRTAASLIQDLVNGTSSVGGGYPAAPPPARTPVLLPLDDSCW